MYCSPCLCSTTDDDLVAQLQAKLRDLEQQMVTGGAMARDQKLQEGLKTRKKKAEDRRRKLRDALSNADDDGILEGIYDNLQV